jgi:lipoate-protein ligase A
MGRAMEEEVRDGGNGAVPVAGSLIHDDLTGGDAVAVWWVPAGPLVVLGRSNDAAREVDLDRCRAEGVSVIRRRGGGGAVVLEPGTVCVTAAWKRPKAFAPAGALRAIGEMIADALADLGIGVSLRGTGDLAIGERKLAGSSLAVGRDGVLFQMSLLRDADLARIARLLRHPGREPEYRRGRSHGEFLTSLAREGIDVGPATLGAAMAAACRNVRLTRVGARCAAPSNGSTREHEGRGTLRPYADANWTRAAR